MKWGQENLRFTTMRLKGEKKKKEKNSKTRNYENIKKYDKIKILKNDEK